MEADNNLRRNVEYTRNQLKKTKIFHSFAECNKEVQRLKLLQKQHPLCPEAIPLELADLDQWIVWSYEVCRWQNGMFGVGKVPYQAKNPNEKASRTTSLDWCDLETAVQCVKNNQYHVDGIGFVFSREDGLSGVDFDNCRDPLTGHIRKEYQFWIDALGGYAEVSPSRTGVKVWVKGTVSDRYFKTEKSTGFRILNFAGGEIEVYRRGQYFTVTTQRLKDAWWLAPAQTELDVLSEWSLSKVSRDISYYFSSALLSMQETMISELSLPGPTDEDVKRELSLLQKYWDEISYGYIDESSITQGVVEMPTDFDVYPIGDVSYVNIGQSRCHRCGRKCEPQYELCSDCYRDGEPEYKVKEAVFNYFSKPKFQKDGFFPKYEHKIRIGTYTPRPDVVLFDQQGNLAAIAECKRSGVTNYGIEQLKSYLTMSDAQFGVFANSTEPDKWIYFENLRRYNFKQDVSRSQFETEIVTDRSIESIREEKDRLVRETEQANIQLTKEVCSLSVKKDQLQNEMTTRKQQHILLKQQCMRLLQKISFLERDKDRLEKNRNKIKLERKVQREALKKISSDLDGRIKHKTSLIQELESKLGELEVTFAQKPIYGEIEKELKRLNELESEITRKQQAVGRYKEKYAAYEKNKVEINQKIQRLVQVSEKRESILKQLRVVVNRLKTTNPEQEAQIERHREQLVQDLRKQGSISTQLTAEINQLKETQSRLETEIMEKTQQSPDEEKEMRPAYIQIQVQIDKLEAEKSKIEAEIGHRIFLLLQYGEINKRKVHV